MKLAAIYARVSTARQEEEQTIKTQLSAVNDLVQKSSFNVVEKYIDEGWTGDVLARPALDKLRQDAKAKIWEVVVVYDPDRIARRYSYQELVMDELREAGIEVVFVTISAPKNSEDKILYGVRGLFAEYERAKIGERFRLGKLRKVKEGHILVSEPLYGYRYILKQERVHGYYEVNEDEARVVRMIFDWVDRDGLTLRGIVRKLQELGIKPRKSKRGVWATSTLSTLLKHKAYIGEAHWGSSYAVVPEKPTSKEKYRKIRKSSRRIKPEAEWFTIPVPAIIDRNVFARVQEKIKANFLLSRRNTINEYLLTGRIYCACGRKRAGEGPQHGKHLYYRCLDRVLNFPLPRSCMEAAVNARTADRLLWNGLTKLMTSPELMQNQIQRWMNSQQNKVVSSGVDTEFLKKEIIKLKDQEDRYNKAYGSGVFTLEQLKEYTVSVKEKVVLYESQMLKSEQEKLEQQPAPLPDAKEVVVFAREASKALQNLNFTAKKAIVSNVIERVVGTRDKLQVYGFIPVTTESNVNVLTNDRHRQGIPRHEFNENGSKLIPFRFEVDIPLLTVNHIQN
jgi:site-specific DNA recombinase